VEEKKTEAPPPSYGLVEIARFGDKLEGAFAHPTNSGFLPRVKTLRMFLLKALERLRGVAFLRSALQHSLFSTSKWMNAWVDTEEELGLRRFMGTNKLPQTNPFKLLTNWQLVHEATCAALMPQGASLEALDGVFGADRPTWGPIKGAFLATIFHEIFLTKLLAGGLAETPRLQNLRRWIRDATVFSPGERNLCIFFTGATDSKAPEQIQKLFQFNEESSPEMVAKVRVLVHIAIVGMVGQDQFAIANYMNTVIFRWDTLPGTYMPCMPEDEQAMAVRVLGGRWYTCANGHAYYVDACGRPTQILKCSTCGVDIGGESHNLLSSNKDLDDKLTGNTNYSQHSTLNDNSPAGYCMADAAQEGKLPDIVRAQTPGQNRAIRFVFHAGLVLSAIAANSGTWDKDVFAIVNTELSQPADQDCGVLFSQHVNQDWKLLKKARGKTDSECAHMLHAILLDKQMHAGLAEETKVSPQVANLLLEVQEIQAQMHTLPGDHPRLAEYQNDLEAKLFQLQELDAVASNTYQIKRRTEAELMQQQSEQVAVQQGVALKESGARNAWELAVLKALEPLMEDEGFGEALQMVETAFSPHADDTDGGTFIAELKERDQISAMDLESRCQGIPALYRYRHPFVYSDFRSKFLGNPKLKEKFSVLSFFLEDEEKLRGLRHLPKMLQWVDLVVKRYNGLLTEEKAKEMSMQRVVDEHKQPSVRAKWANAFEGFKSAWNNSWEFVERFECTDITYFKDKRIDGDTQVLFALPCQSDTGILPLALSRYMSQTHNAFLEIVNANLLMTGNELKQMQSREKVVSSRFFTDSQTITYNFEGQFLPFLARHCVNVGDFGEISYDYKSAEQYLLDMYFTGKPLIKLDIPTFRYIGDTQAVFSVANKIPQATAQSGQALAPEDTDKILAELGSQSAAHACLELLETVMVLLSATGGDAVLSVGNTQLLTYVETTLQMGNADFGSSYVEKNVKLKHLDQLHEVLKDFTGMTAQVRSKYKVALAPEDEEALASTLVYFEEMDLLLASFKFYIREVLTQDYTSDKSSIKSMLEYAEIDGRSPGECDWFIDHFPDSITMAKCVATRDWLRDNKKVLAVDGAESELTESKGL
jgi:hypothetical protein